MTMNGKIEQGGEVSRERGSEMAISHWRRSFLALALAALALTGMYGAVGASAKTVNPYSYVGSFDGTGSTVGRFDEVGKIAVNEETGNVYVVSRGYVSQFDADGTPLPFTDPSRNGASSIALAPYSAPGQGSPNGGPITVDNNGGATQGNIYVHLGQLDNMIGFDETGKVLPGKWPICAFPCGRGTYWFAGGGVAVDPDGIIWVASPALAPCESQRGCATAFLSPFEVGGLPLESGEEVVQLEEPLPSPSPTDLAIDAERNFYVPGQRDGGILKYDRSGNPVMLSVDGGSGFPYETSIAFDQSSQSLLVAGTPQVAEAFLGEGPYSFARRYSAAGDRIDEFGAPTGSYSGLKGSRGIAVNSSTDRVYVGSNWPDRFYGRGNTTAGSPVITGIPKYEGYPGTGLYVPGMRVTGEGIPAGATVVSIDSGSQLTISANATKSKVENELFYFGKKEVDMFEPGAPVVVPDVVTNPPVTNGTSASFTGTVDPDGGGNTTECYFAYGESARYETFDSNPPSYKKAPCDQGNVLPSDGGVQQVSATVTGLDRGRAYHVRLFASNAHDVPQGGLDRRFWAAELPVISDVAISAVNTNTAVVDATIAQEGGPTDYMIEYGPTDSYGSTTGMARLNDVVQAHMPLDPKDLAEQLGGLTPGTTYHYRIVAKNDAGTVFGPDRVFHTFAPVSLLDDPCPNALARQQTGSRGLLDCRAYELVSARYAGGFNVESDLVPGQTPFGGFPAAQDRVLYGVNAGVIPGTGNPTNRGLDPYVAKRGSDGWQTTYVGIPANGTPSIAPFASSLSGAAANLTAFAFGGPDICSPCFPDGSVGVPLRLEDGSLVQGMAGSIPVSSPEAAGTVLQPLSGDGSHLVFGSTAKFEPEDDDGQLTIYDRNLKTGVTKVISRLPNGASMSPGVAELDISTDGTRILLGEPVSTDGAGNQLYHLFMYVGGADATVDLTPGTSSGVLYGGMAADGSKVFFTTRDALATASDTDADTSADLYAATVSAAGATLTRVSTGSAGTGNIDTCSAASGWNGSKCDVVAISGGGGVALGGGAVYFFSPEQLDGGGTAGEPNLYAAKAGAAPQYVSTLDTADGAVAHGLDDAGVRYTEDFQTTPSGQHAVFVTTRSLTGYENRGFTEVFRTDLDAPGAVVCVSCTPSNVPGIGDSTLASNGLSITDDGRVFFNSTNAFVLRDANEQQDAYEWTPADGGRVELISSGDSPKGSSLLTVTANGSDAYFFTNATLVKEDENGPQTKLYDAREGGGFFRVPPVPPCVASDECHGPSTQAPGAPNIRTVAGTDGNKVKKSKKCKKGFVKKKKRCVKKRKHRRHRHHHHSTRRHG
jgi:hypothetical protein